MELSSDTLKGLEDRRGTCLRARLKGRPLEWEPGGEQAAEIQAPAKAMRTKGQALAQQSQVPRGGMGSGAGLEACEGGREESQEEKLGVYSRAGWGLGLQCWRKVRAETVELGERMGTCLDPGFGLGGMENEMKTKILLHIY